MIQHSFHGLGSPRLVLTANPSHSRQQGVWRVPGKVGEGAGETRFSQEDDGTAHGGRPLETAPMWPADNTGAQGDCDARWPRAGGEQGGLRPPVRSLQLRIPPGGRDLGAPVRGGPGTSGARGTETGAPTDTFLGQDRQGRRPWGKGSGFRDGRRPPGRQPGTPGSSGDGARGPLLAHGCAGSSPHSAPGRRRPGASLLLTA